MPRGPSSSGTRGRLAASSPTLRLLSWQSTRGEDPRRRNRRAPSRASRPSWRRPTGPPPPRTSVRRPGWKIHSFRMTSGIQIQRGLSPSLSHSHTGTRPFRSSPAAQTRHSRSAAELDGRRHGRRRTGGGDRRERPAGALGRPELAVRPRPRRTRRGGGIARWPRRGAGRRPRPLQCWRLAWRNEYGLFGRSHRRRAPPRREAGFQASSLRAE